MPVFGIPTEARSGYRRFSSLMEGKYQSDVPFGETYVSAASAAELPVWQALAPSMREVFAAPVPISRLNEPGNVVVS